MDDFVHGVSSNVRRIGVQIEHKDAVHCAKNVITAHTMTQDYWNFQFSNCLDSFAMTS